MENITFYKWQYETINYGNVSKKCFRIRIIISSLLNDLLCSLSCLRFFCRYKMTHCLSQARH